MTNMMKYGRHLVSLAVCVLALVTIWRYAEVILPATPVVPPRLELGRVLELPGLTLRGSTRTVLIRMQTTCPACNASVGFFTALSDAAKRAPIQTRVVFLVTETDQVVADWVSQRGLGSLQRVAITAPATFGFVFIPTVLLVDKGGVITDMLVERPSDAERLRFLARVSASEATPAVDNSAMAPEVDFDQLTALHTAGATIIDIRRRDDRPWTAIPRIPNIPYDELAHRAQVEIGHGQQVVLRCPPKLAIQCRVAVRDLVRERYVVRLFIG